MKQHTAYLPWLTRLCRIGYVVFLSLSLTPTATLAHGGGSEKFQTFTQTVGPYELDITLDLPPTAPAPLFIDIVPPPTIGETTITFRAVPRGAQPKDVSIAEVKTIAGAGIIYYTELAVDRLGDWDLEVRASGPEGKGSALLPFTIKQDPIPSYTIPLLAGLSSLGVLMIASIMTSAMYHGRQHDKPRWLSSILSQGIFAAFIVTLIFGIQQFNDSLRTTKAANAPPPVLGRPHVNLVVRTSPSTPTTGKAMELALVFSDGGTGRPVEDIITHHDALVHLVVINENGSFFEHTHPSRGAPGTYATTVTPTQPGRYTVYAEIERTDSGTQVVRGEFAVMGEATAPPVQPQPLGPQHVGAYTITVSSSQMPLRAGEQTTFTASIADASGPVRDLQPWLGMAGHFLARSTDGAIFAHVHAAEKVPPYGRPIIVQGTTYGPNVRFAYSFPQPGEYRVWMQFKRAGEIITVPLKIVVQ